MSQLSEMMPEEAGLLMGLPYRVGVWVSHSDDEEGETDDEREMKALEHIIKSITKAEKRSEFVHEVFAGTLAKRDQWPVWKDHSFDILADCEKAVTALTGNVSNDELKDYKSALMEIAKTVAEAYGEFGMMDDDEGGFTAAVDKIIGLFNKEPEEHPMNISPAEDSALSRLAMALRVQD